MPHLLLATHNAHKTAEVRAILEGLFSVTDLTSWPDAPEPEETGETFVANAEIKALAASQLAGVEVWVLADDSGLEVDALEGAPGVRSARYAGTQGDHAANRTRLLSELQAVRAHSPEARRARFRCALVLVHHGKVAGEFHGAIEGHIAKEERGEGGFGYDSLFVPEGYTETFAELPSAVKNALSHRGRALEAFTAWWREQRGDESPKSQF